ncbi:MAG TPA: HAD family phosphatase [Sphingobacterium sp.]|nr:HAD family phosphatase [Sphingobacterium sp.]
MINLTESSLKKLEKLREKTKNHKALLYDVDGTLANNMPAHKAAYIAAAKHYGIPDLDPEIIDRTAGWPTYKLAAEIARLYDKNFDNVEFANLKAKIFIDDFVKLTEPVDFVYAHLLENKPKKRIALVSGGRRSTLRHTLQAIQVEGMYEVLVSSDDTKRGKPSPDPFLLAAKKLNIKPEDCIVMEDGNPGVQGAKAAGMGWVRIDLL